MADHAFGSRPIRFVVEKRPGSFGEDGTRRNCIYTDSQGADLERMRTSEVDHSGFSRGKSALQPRRHDSECRTDVDDCAVSPLDHAHRDRSRTVEGAVQVDIENTMPILGQESVNGLPILADVYASVIHQDGDRAHALLNALYHSFDPIRVRDIRMEEF